MTRKKNYIKKGNESGNTIEDGKIDEYRLSLNALA